MRVKRHKSFRKSMTFYSNAFKFREPYRIIVDGTFITEALKQRIHIKEQLPKIIGSQRCTPMVTSCIFSELKKLGPNFGGSQIIAKGFYRLKCQHDPELTAEQCIKQCIGEANSKRFIIASQDKNLVCAMRLVPGVPIVSLRRQVPFLETPSEASKAKWGDIELKKMGACDWEKKVLPELKAKEEAEPIVRKMKKKKGQNPMSCMKKKTKPQPSSRKPRSQEVEEPVEKKKKVRSRRMKKTEEAAPATTEA